MAAEDSREGGRSAYARLLEEHPLPSHDRAREVLEKPLGHLLYSLYQERHQGLPMEVDRFVHDDCVFVYDSGGQFLESGVNRVVGAMACSRERVEFGELLERLREERNRRAPPAATIELILLRVSAYQDSSVRRSRAVNRACALLCGADRLSLPEIVERIVVTRRSPGRGNAIVLGRVARELRAVLGATGRTIPAFRLRPGQAIDAAVLAPIREMARAADAECPAASRAVVGRLLDLVPEGGELKRRLRGQVTDQLLAAMKQYLEPLLSSERPPRDASGQRWLRLSRHTAHAYDMGHFVPHGVGGPTRINLFRQERRLNRGWSAAGRTYRWLERYVASRPGTFYFVRPVYDDLSDTPRYLEWGVLIEGAEGERLAAEIARRPQLEIVRPAEPRAAIQAAWLLGWFENFPPGAERLDLDPPASPAERPDGGAR
jgi:hypothetical protein